MKNGFEMVQKSFYQVFSKMIFLRLLGAEIFNVPKNQTDNDWVKISSWSMLYVGTYPLIAYYRKLNSETNF